MMSRAALLGLLGVCAFFGARRDCSGQDIFPASFRLDNPTLFRGPSLPSFFNSERVLGSTSFGWTSLPSLRAQTSSPAASDSARNRSFLDRLSAAAPKADYVSGEVGFLYGSGIGRSRGDFKETYIVGEVGDEHFHITVGAAYQDSNFRVPRGGR